MVELLKAYEKQEKQIRANKAGVFDELILIFLWSLKTELIFRFDRSFVSFYDKHENMVHYK